MLPWCEGTTIHPETFLLQDKLIQLNQLGFWTINSQPAVNGLPSSHPSFGWGGNDGYIYQKPYCEFFCEPKLLHFLLQNIHKYPTISVYAVNHDQSSIKATHDDNFVTALTWGVFPNREILQPTIFDPTTYQTIWSEEAFSLWKSSWMNLYELDSPGHSLIQYIYDNFYLVAVLDNDYITHSEQGGQLWDVLIEIGQKL